MSHSHFCDGSPDEVAEDMKKQLDANPNTIQVILLSCLVLSYLILESIPLPFSTFHIFITLPFNDYLFCAFFVFQYRLRVEKSSNGGCTFGCFVLVSMGHETLTLHYTLLYCTVLYCTVLYCTVLYCTVLYCTVLYCTVLHLTLFHFILTLLLCAIRHGWAKAKEQRKLLRGAS